MSRILVVEDETHIAQGLRFNLESEGHFVEITDNGEEALNFLLKQKQSFDVLVLDIMLPGIDGFSVARELRAAKNYVPLLMLTARGRPEDVLNGFDCGADDYLPKPFNLDILLARVNSLLRRSKWHEKTAAVEPVPARETDAYSFDGNTVDFEMLQLRAGDRVIQLTMMEADLLRYFVNNSGHPVSRKAILENVWNLREDTDTRAIDNFIVRLRRYIEPDPSNPKYLRTVRGVGYRFVPDPNDKS